MKKLLITTALIIASVHSVIAQEYPQKPIKKVGILSKDATIQMIENITKSIVQGIKTESIVAYKHNRIENSFTFYSDGHLISINLTKEIAV